MPIRFDGPPGAELQIALDLHLDPEALAVKAVLVAQLVAGHREEALKGIFVGAAPGVVHAHGVIGGDRPVEEAPPRFAGVLGAELVENRGLPPEAQHLVLSTEEIGAGDFFKHGTGVSQVRRYSRGPVTGRRREENGKPGA